MIFADALGIFDASEIASATICNMDTNTYKNLTNEEINEFYEKASGPPQVSVRRALPGKQRGSSAS